MSRSIGKLYAEIDLDASRWEKSQKRLYKDATETTLSIEANFKKLGIKSSAEFDLMRRKIQNSYDMIANSAKATANDIVRAEKAKAEKLNRINEMQYGKQISFIQSLKSHWVAYTAVAASGIIAIGRTKSIIEESIRLANEQTTAERRLESVVRATGGAAGYTAGELKKMASDLQSVTRIGDETTIAAMAILATFKDIKGDTFREATEAAMDMSEVFGQDLKSSITQVGKALNDPISGLTSLRRIGVSFTDQQRDQIKTMVEVNDLAGAQALILQELQSEFGGAARAARDADGGIQTVANAIGDFKEEIGFAFTKSTEFRDSMSDIREIFEDAEFKQSIVDISEEVAGFASKLAQLTRSAVDTLDVSILSKRANQLIEEGRLTWDVYKAPDTETLIKNLRSAINAIDGVSFKVDEQKNWWGTHKENIKETSEATTELSESSQKFIDTLTVEHDQLGMNARQLEEYAAKKAGLKGESLKEAMAIYDDIEAYKDEQDRLQRRYARDAKIGKEIESSMTATWEESQKVAEATTEEIADTTITVFDDMWSDVANMSIENWKDIWGSLEAITKRAIFNMAQEMILQPIIMPVVQGAANSLQSVISGGLSLGGANLGSLGGLSGGISSILSSPVLPWQTGTVDPLTGLPIELQGTSWGNMLGTAGLYSTGYNLLAPVFDMPQSTGSSIGSFGAAATAALLDWNPVGVALSTIAGGYVGDLLNNVFGGSKSNKAMFSGSQYNADPATIGYGPNGLELTQAWLTPEGRFRDEAAPIVSDITAGLISEVNGVIDSVFAALPDKYDNILSKELSGINIDFADYTGNNGDGLWAINGKRLEETVASFGARAAEVIYNAVMTPMEDVLVDYISGGIRDVVGSDILGKLSPDSAIKQQIASMLSAGTITPYSYGMGEGVDFEKFAVESGQLLAVAEQAAAVFGSVEATVEGILHPLSDFDQSIADINTQFDGLVATTKAVGASIDYINGLEADRAQAINDATEAYRTSIQDMQYGLMSAVDSTAELKAIASRYGMENHEDLYNRANVMETFSRFVNAATSPGGTDRSTFFETGMVELDALLEEVGVDSEQLSSDLKYLADMFTALDQRALSVADTFAGMQAELDKIVYLSVSGTKETQYYLDQINAMATGNLSLEQVEEYTTLVQGWYSAAITEAQTTAQIWGQVTDAAAGLIDQIDDTIKSIKYSDLNVALPTQKFEEASQDYASLYNKAVSGDQPAMQEYLGFVSTYLQSAQDTHKSSPAYQAIYGSVMGDMNLIKGMVSHEDYQQQLYNETIAQGQASQESYTAIAAALMEMTAYAGSQLAALETLDLSSEGWAGVISSTVADLGNTMVDSLGADITSFLSSVDEFVRVDFTAAIADLDVGIQSKLATGIIGLDTNLSGLLAAGVFGLDTSLSELINTGLLGTDAAIQSALSSGVVGLDTTISELLGDGLLNLDVDLGTLVRKGIGGFDGLDTTIQSLLDAGFNSEHAGLKALLVSGLSPLNTLGELATSAMDTLSAENTGFKALVDNGLFGFQQFLSNDLSPVFLNMKESIAPFIGKDLIDYAKMGDGLDREIVDATKLLGGKLNTALGEGIYGVGAALYSDATTGIAGIGGDLYSNLSNGIAGIGDDLYSDINTALDSVDWVKYVNDLTTNTATGVDVAMLMSPDADPIPARSVQDIIDRVIDVYRSPDFLTENFSKWTNTPIDALDWAGMYTDFFSAISQQQQSSLAMGYASGLENTNQSMSWQMYGAQLLAAKDLYGFADGGISTSPQLAWVSEGRYSTEAHVPLPDGRSIPVTMNGRGEEVKNQRKLIEQNNRIEKLLQQLVAQGKNPKNIQAVISKDAVRREANDVMVTAANRGMLEKGIF